MLAALELPRAKAAGRNKDLGAHCNEEGLGRWWVRGKYCMVGYVGGEVGSDTNVSVSATNKNGVSALRMYTLEGNVTREHYGTLSNSTRFSPYAPWGVAEAPRR